MAGILLTGSTGFIGRRLAAALVPTAGSHLRLLVRDPSRLPAGLAPPAAVHRGGCSDRAAVARATASACTIVHLAAQTGKASRDTIFEVNAEGTRRLVEAAKQAGAKRFLFVSSIATGFHDRRWYHYAEAKREAEQAVRESGLDWVIVRPTMVLGPGSPVQAALRRLASAPVGILFGSGRVPVQPIHVDDLVEVLARLLDQQSLGRALIEAGGPEVLPLGELLRRMRSASRGRPGPFLRLPVTPLRALLGMLDRRFARVLPVTAGQLASFVNPGVAAPLPDFIPTPSRGINEMLSGATA